MFYYGLYPTDNYGLEVRLSTDSLKDAHRSRQTAAVCRCGCKLFQRTINENAETIEEAAVYFTCMECKQPLRMRDIFTEEELHLFGAQK